MNLCTDCKHYQARRSEAQDICSHARAMMGGVRAPRFYTCEAMRAGICANGTLFEARLDSEAQAPVHQP